MSAQLKPEKEVKPLCLGGQKEIDEIINDLNGVKDKIHTIVIGYCLENNDPGGKDLKYAVMGHDDIVLTLLGKLREWAKLQFTKGETASRVFEILKTLDGDYDDRLKTDK